MTNFFLIFFLLREHRWFNGRMLACHAGGPGSIPGRCMTLLGQKAPISTGEIKRTMK